MVRRKVTSSMLGMNPSQCVGVPYRVMRTALLICLVALIGCEQPKPPEQVADEVVKQMAERTTKPDTSLPAPELPFPKNPPKTPDLAKIAAESAKITQLKIEDIVLGSGPVVKVGSQICVHYVGMLPDNYVFDTSYKDKADPFQFRFDPKAQDVIAGWYEGIAGMRVGGHRRITIPASLAYGSKPPLGSPIPPNAALIFEIQLMYVQETP
jgi:FKBP-type peptidyl-prolyl cis-trans isomerase